MPYVNFDAGVEILLKNEIEWSEIHSLFETNAHKAEVSKVSLFCYFHVFNVILKK